MKNYFFAALALLLVMSSFTIKHHYQKGNWEQLGTRIVNMSLDHDEILVTAAEGTFTKIKIHVSKAPLHIINCKVVFGNGEETNLDIRHDFAKGSDTRIIDLPGEKRIIRKIIFNYKSKPTAKGRAVVTVFGMH